MIRIAIICILISLANSEVNSCSDNDLSNLKQALFESMEYMEENDNVEDVVLFTEEAPRNAQSDIIKFMKGDQSVEEKFKGSVNLIRMKTPTKWTLTRHLNKAVWDFPKLVDIQTPIQDITIAFYLHQLLQNAKSLKILVLSLSSQIVQESNFQLVRNLNVIERIFGNKFKDLFPSIGYIFKDLPKRVVDQEVVIGTYSDDIKKELESFAKRRDQTSSNIKNYFNYLINNFDSHACFSTDKVVPGFVESQFYRVIQNNNSIQGTKLSELPLNILSSSKLCLSNAKGKLFSAQRIDQLLNIIKTKSLQSVQLLISSSEKANNENKLKALLNETTQTLKVLNDLNSKANEIALYKRMEIFESFFNVLKDKTDKNDLLRTVKLMNFVEKVLDTKESSNVNQQFQNIVDTLIQKANEAKRIIRGKL